MENITIAVRKQLTGELQNLPKPKKNLSILWKRSAMELQSISVHYERFKTCPDRLHWCCVLSASIVLPPLVSFWRKKFSCCLYICSFPSHFSQIRAHGRRDLLAIFWVFVKTLPHFQSRKKRPLICVSWRLQIRISHIPKWKQKARPLPKMSSTYHIVCSACGWSEAAPGCETLSAVTGRFFFAQSDLHSWWNITNM